MLKNFFFCAFVVLVGLIATKALYAQSYTRGNLLKVNIGSGSISQSDTLGSWEQTDYYVSSGRVSNYYGSLCMPSGKTYFLKSINSWVYHTYGSFTGGANFLEAEENSAEQRQFSLTDFGRDFSTLYMFDETMIFRTKSGQWLMNGELGNSFLFNNDSLFVINKIVSGNGDLKNRFVIILGIVNGKALTVFKDDYSFNYDIYLLDNPDNPDINENTARKIIFKDSSQSSFNWPLKIMQLPGENLYLVSTSMGGLNIFRFSNDTLSYIKDAFPSYHYPVRYSDNILFKDCGSLYLFSGSALEKYEYDSGSMEFKNRKLIFQKSGSSGIIHDRDFKYLAGIDSDSLWVFDVEKEKYIRNYSLSGIRYLSYPYPFMDSSSVYIHHVVTEYTGVESEKASEIKDYRLSAYPNPFNSSAKIEYSLPEDKQIEISIFDMLGRKVTSLVKRLEKKGDHTVMFDASELPSGIYFYNLSCDNFSRTNKILLLK